MQRDGVGIRRWDYGKIAISIQSNTFRNKRLLQIYRSAPTRPFPRERNFRPFRKREGGTRQSDQPDQTWENALDIYWRQVLPGVMYTCCYTIQNQEIGV